MNAERLNRILTDLSKDLKKEKTLSLLQQVRDNLQNQVNQPNQPTFQTNLVSSLDQLYANLSTSSYNNYSPSWKEIISEISGRTLFGIDLKAEIEKIFSTNAITPAKALEDVKSIYDNFQRFENAIGNTINGLKELGINREELEKGECELGYSIPRNFIENRLSDLKKEINELLFILNHISEAVTGEKQEFKVKTISYSDFLLYIIIGLQIADTLSKATERILNHYKQVLEIRVLRNQLKEKGIPDDKTQGIEEHVNSLMEKEIKTIAAEITKSNKKGEQGRKNELENGVIIALNKLANRIDKGFKVEIRVESLPEPKKGEEQNDEDRQKNEIINSIKKSARNIDFLDTSGKAILELPEKID